MSKELEALKRMEYFVNEEMGIKTFKQSGWHIEGTDDYELVKEALMRLEAIENATSNEVMDCLFRLGHNHRMDYINGKHKEDYSIVEQALLKAQEQEKVLKIIKEKRVNVDELLDCISLCDTDNEALDEYNDKVSFIWKDPNDYLLTKEEFDTLKEWFK